MAQQNVQRLISQNGGPSGPTYTPTTDFASMTFDDFDRILSAGSTPTTAIENVSAAWKDLALALRTNIMGRPLAFDGSSDPFANGFPADTESALAKLDKTNDGSFDSLLASLAGWQGTAADAFLKKALEVRSFALGLAQRFYASDNGAMYAGDTWNGCEFNYTVDSMAKALAPTQDIYRQLKPWYEVTVIQNLWDFLAGTQVWNGTNLQIQGTFTLTSIKGGTSTITVRPAYGQQKLSTGQPTGYQVPTGFTFTYESQRNFQSTTGDTYLNGVSYVVNGAVSGSTTTGPTTVTFQPDADRSGPLAFLGGTSAIADLRKAGGGQRILYSVTAGQHHANLTSLLTITAGSYVWGASQMPDTPTPPKDVSTGGSTSSSNTNTTTPSLPTGPANPTPPTYPTTHNTPLSSPSTGATGHPTTGANGQTTPTNWGGNNVGKPGTGGDMAGYTPITTGTYHPGSSSPGSANLGDFGKGTSALDAGKLASFAPGAGTGFGNAGLGSGGLAGPGGGLDPAGAGGANGLGGLGGGLGAPTGGGAGAGAGAAGVAGRGMPMAPMGAGAGGGKEAKDRQRKAFLTEDDDVWGADGGEPPAVL